MINIIKRISKTLIAASALSVLVFSTVSAETKAVSNGDQVNIRAAATTDAEVLGKLDKNDAVNAVGVVPDFVVIDHNGQDAFVSSQFITFEKADANINSDSEVNTHTAKGMIGSIPAGTAVELVARYGDNVYFMFNDSLGHVHKNNVDSEFKEFLREYKESDLPVSYALVNCDTTLNLRENPSKDGAVIAQMPKGSVLDVLDLMLDNAEWAKVKTSAGKEGYASKEFLDIKEGVKPVEKLAAQSVGTGSSAKGAEIVAYAKQFIGTPYVYGGTALGSGVDCSGFVYSVYKNFGITLNRTSRSMPANGTKVSKSELVAGDLVFFSNYGASNIQHVGIYCGDGTFIHAASGGPRRVMISGIGESYYVTNYITAARIL